MISPEKRFHHFVHSLSSLTGYFCQPRHSFLTVRLKLRCRTAHSCVRPGYSVTMAEQRHIGQEVSFEFRTTISLDQMHMSPKSPPHALRKEPGTMLRRQFRS